MKKTLALLLTLSGLLLASCGGGSNTPTPEGSSAPAQSSAPSSSSSEESGVSYISEDSDSGIGERTNDEPYDYDSIKVNAPANPLAEDFAFGADLSSVAEVEACGGVFYNEEGHEQDVFKILAADGVNYCRLRLWNDPYSALLTDEQGDPLSYGGGTNDLKTDIALAKRAKAAGMKLLLDFHYSDHWADPSKYYVPKAWAEELSTDKPELLGDFTRDALRAFKEAGVYVDAVQIGNEENYGLAGERFLYNPGRIVQMVEAGVSAAKEVFPDTKTLVHLTNIKSPKGVYNFLDAVNDIPYDVVGLSYYPYWHGSKDNLLSVMNHIVDAYGRPSWIVETSYGFTDEPNEYCHNQYHSSTFENAGGYLTGFQGQATEVSDVVSVLSSVKNGFGQGVFYWEPAWLPVEGSTWASKAGEFYNEHGRDGTAEQVASYRDDSTLPSWSNQGWFSYTGKALPSASTYRHIVDGDKTAEERVVGLRTPEIDVNVNLVQGEVVLPRSANVVTDFDAMREKAVVWNQQEIDAILEGGDGDYDVHGLVDGRYDIVAHVTAETNWVRDYSFEQQPSGEQVPVSGEDWQLECNVEGSARIEAKSEGNIDGEKYFHWYNSGAFKFTLSQTLHSIRAGDYDLSTFIMAGDNVDDYASLRLFYQIGDAEPVEVSIKDTAVRGWGAPLKKYMTRQAIEHVIVESDGTDVTIGLIGDCGPTAWGHCDLWSFSGHKEYVPPEDYCADGGLEDGGFLAQNVFSRPSDPWIVDACTATRFEIDNVDRMQSVSANHLSWYSAGTFAFAFHQNIKNLAAGDYRFSFQVLSATAPSYDYFRFYYLVDGEESTRVDIEVKEQFKPWVTSDEASTATVSLNLTIPAAKKVTLGFSVSAKAGAWGRMTDLALTPAN